MVGCTSQSGEANPGLRGLYLQTMLSEISEISRTYEARPGVSSKRRALALRAKAGPSMLFLIGQGRRRLSVTTLNSMCDCTIAFDIESLHAPPPRQPTATRAHPTAPITMAAASHIDALSALPDPSIITARNKFFKASGAAVPGQLLPSVGDGFTVHAIQVPKLCQGPTGPGPKKEQKVCRPLCVDHAPSIRPPGPTPVSLFEQQRHLASPDGNSFPLLTS